MNKIVEAWKNGLRYLIVEEDMTSFYTFFTLIFAEVAYLQTHYQGKVATEFTAILLGYIANVIIFAWLKENWVGTKKEVVFTILYDSIFVLLFVVGCFVDAKLNIILTAISLLSTLILLCIRNSQLTQDIDITKMDTDSFIASIKSIFRVLMYTLFQCIVIAGPFIIFMVCLAKIEKFSIELKLIISVLYLLCIPFIVYYEDSLAASNIFELGFEIEWNKELEEFNKSLEDLDDDEDK